MQLDDVFDSKHEIYNEIYYAVLLHDHPELLNVCCELINQEWKRSHVARLRSISGSSSNFPTSVLLLRNSKEPELIGHCKLSKISHFSPVIFVDTVVIHPKYRGKGLGRLLMQKAESYVKSKGIQCIYLTTMGQELFYEKLGYSFCEPINIYGGHFNYLKPNIKNSDLIQHEDVVIKEKSSENKMLTNECMTHKYLSTTSENPSPAPPNPPPPPPISSLGPTIVHMTSKKSYMRKMLF